MPCMQLLLTPVCVLSITCADASMFFADRMVAVDQHQGDVYVLAVYEACKEQLEPLTQQQQQEGQQLDQRKGEPQKQQQQQQQEGQQLSEQPFKQQQQQQQEQEQEGQQLSEQLFKQQQQQQQQQLVGQQLDQREGEQQKPRHCGEGRQLDLEQQSGQQLHPQQPHAVCGSSGLLPPDSNTTTSNNNNSSSSSSSSGVSKGKAQALTWIAHTIDQLRVMKSISSCPLVPNPPLPHTRTTTDNRPPRSIVTRSSAGSGNRSMQPPHSALAQPHTHANSSSVVAQTQLQSLTGGHDLTLCNSLMSSVCLCLCVNMSSVCLCVNMSSVCLCVNTSSQVLNSQIHTHRLHTHTHMHTHMNTSSQALLRSGYGTIVRGTWTTCARAKGEHGCVQKGKGCGKRGNV